MEEHAVCRESSGRTASPANRRGPASVLEGAHHLGRSGNVLQAASGQMAGSQSPARGGHSQYAALLSRSMERCIASRYTRCGTRQYSLQIRLCIHRHQGRREPYARGRPATNLSTTCADSCGFGDMFSLRRKGQAEKRATTPSPVAASPHGDLKIGAFRPGWLPDDATAREPAARPQVRSCWGTVCLLSEPLTYVPLHRPAGRSSSSVRCRPFNELCERQPDTVLMLCRT